MSEREQDISMEQQGEVNDDKSPKLEWPESKESDPFKRVEEVRQSDPVNYEARNEDNKAA